MPARPTLAKIRDAVAEAPDRFEAVIGAPAFRRRFGKLSDDAMLVRLPRGYAPGHPAEPWLRYQSFTVSRPLTARETASARLPDTLAKDVVVMLTFLRWLNGAVGYQPRERRVVA